jgi:hypothetical protein
MVWSETLGTYHEMISAEGWATKDTIDVPIVQTLTFKVRVHATLRPIFDSSLFLASSSDNCKMRIWSSFQLVSTSYSA